MSRALLRSLLELRAPAGRLVPSIRPTTITTSTTKTATVVAPTVRFFNQTAQHVESSHPDPTIVANAASSQQQQPQQQSQPQQLPFRPKREPPRQPPPVEPKPISESVRKLLPVMAAQPGHYATVHIHGQPYLVTEGDSVRLPFRMPGVSPGAVLRLNRASVLGSRDFTLKGAPYVDERLFECRAVVTATEAEPMRTMIKKKRRCRRTKRVTSKHRYTVLRISELKIRTDVLNEA
ncbi:hypothetical protein VTH82DRAFT_2649 [Thermothelomyces myriococcoides]